MNRLPLFAPKPPARLLAAGATAVTLLASALPGQPSATPSYLPKEQDSVQLEKFEVSTERGGIEPYTIKRSITGTKTDTALLDVPQSVTVITRELIDDQSMRGIGDLTRYVPGVGIAQGEGNRDTPVLRGNSTTADFFVDGIRDDVQYLRDLYNVDRVEILKGPNAMIFGRGGTGGVINRVTKQANGVSVRELSLQAGSWEQYRATLDVGQAVNDAFAVRLTGLFEDSESFRDDVELKRWGLNPTVLYALTERTALRAGYEYFKDERTADRGVPSYQGRPIETDPATFFGDPERSVARANVHSVFVDLDHRFENGISLRNHTRYAAYDKFYQNVFPGAVSADATQVSIAAYNAGTDRDNVFNQTDVVIPFETGTVSHLLVTGVELGRQETDNNRLTGYFTSVGPTATSVLVPVANPRATVPIAFAASATDADNSGDVETASLYVQDQITFSPHWQAIAGVRLERFDVDFRNNRTGANLTNRDDLVSPRLGVVYKPVDTLAIYTSYGTTSVPRAGEQLSSLTLSNRSLDPEEFKNYEVGLKWDARPDLAFSVAAYRLDRENVAIADPADPTRSLLVKGQKVEGIEFGATGRITDQWSIAGGYAYQDGEIRTTQSATVVAGARLAQLPRHSASLWNRYDLNEQWGFGLGAIYRDEIFASVDNTTRVPSFVRVDAAVFYRINEAVRAQVNIENVFDREYFASAHSNNNISPGSPRALRVSLTTRF